MRDTSARGHGSPDPLPTTMVLRASAARCQILVSGDLSIACSQAASPLCQHGVAPLQAPDEEIDQRPWLGETGCWADGAAFAMKSERSRKIANTAPSPSPPGAVSVQPSTNRVKIESIGPLEVSSESSR